MYKGHPVVVFATEHYNTLGLIRSLGEVGMSPNYIAVKGKAKVASTIKYVLKNYFVNSIDEGYNLLCREYGNPNKGEEAIVLCMEDKVLGVMDEHYDEIFEKFIMFSSGEKGRTLEYMDKFKILELAKKHGLKTLDTIVVDRGDIPADFEYPVITKSISPTVGGWKSDVHICENAEELKSAYDHVLSSKVVIQKYIDKKNEYCLDGISFNKGNEVMIPIESTYNYLIKGYYSPYMTVKPFVNEEMKKALDGMMAEIGFEGIYSIEFLIDKDDNYYFSEINFRHSTWGYAATVAGMNMPELWIKGMIDGSIAADRKKTFEPFTAMVEPIDYQKRVVEKGMNLKEWVGELLDCKCPFYFNKNDMEPFFEMVRNNGKLR